MGPKLRDVLQVNYGNSNIKIFLYYIVIVSVMAISYIIKACNTLIRGLK